MAPRVEEGRVEQRKYATSLMKAIALLESFRDYPSQSVTEIAERMDWSKSSAVRLARALASAGFLIRHETTRRYGLGLGLWKLGALAVERIGLPDATRAAMRHLATETGETIHLAVLDGTDVVYIDKIDGTHDIVAYTRVGGRNPAHAVASGKVLLSALSETELLTRIPLTLRGFTDRTVTTRQALLEELRHVREHGYAVNRGELRADVGGIASIIRDSAGHPVAALGVTCPVARLDDISSYSAAVVNAAASLSGTGVR